MTSAANGADSGGQGAVNIRFVTKSGTNTFKGSVFHHAAPRRAERQHVLQQPQPGAIRRTASAPKAELRQYQPGFNAGGPIMIPGLWDGKDKAFFFFNYEDNALAEQDHAQPRHPDAGRGRTAPTPTAPRR